MKKLLCMLVGLSLVLGVSGLAHAADKPKKEKKAPEVVFKERDTNKDSKLSAEEFCAGKEGKQKEAAEKQFTKKDKDGDGSVSLEEFVGKKKKKEQA